MSRRLELNNYHTEVKNYSKQEIEKPEPIIHPVTYESFEASLQDNEFFTNLTVFEKVLVFEYYSAQLVRDATLQISLIELNILEINEINALLSNALKERAKEQISQLSQRLNSKSFLGFPLEDLIEQNWSSNVYNNSFSQLLIDKARELFSIFDFAPSQAAGQFMLKKTEDVQGLKNGLSKYARYDMFKHPLYLSYLNMISQAMFDTPLEDIFSDSKKHIMLATSGAATVQRIIDAVINKKTLSEGSDQSQNINLYLTNKRSYFETNKVFNGVCQSSAEEDSDIKLQKASHNSEELLSVVKDATEIAGTHLFWFENIGNSSYMDIPSLNNIFEYIKDSIDVLNNNESKIIFCFDISIMAGQTETLIKQLKEINSDINVIVTCSLTKFASIGLNKANLGLIYGQGKDIPSIFKHIYSFQSTEGYPALHSIAAMPTVTKDILSERKERFSNNTQFLVDEISKKYFGLVKIIYSGLEDHEDFDLTKNQNNGFGGPFFFIQFKSVELASMFVELINNGFSEYIDLGTSYGLNKTRIEITKDQLGQDDIFVRVSPGTENIRKLLLVLQSIDQTLFTLMVNG